jgi:endo-cleaving rubber dioxygenase
MRYLLLPTDSEWVAATGEPVPISNGDILRTFHSVGTFAYSNLQKWGVPMSASEATAWLHSWQVALALLGVQEQFIPATWADAVAQSAQILTPVIAPTTQGLYLAETLLGYIETPLAGVDTGFLSEFVRYLIGNTVADYLELPVDLVSRAVIDVAWPLFVLFDVGLSVVAPEGASTFSALLKGVSLLFLDHGTSATNVPITLPAGNNPNTH